MKKVLVIFLITISSFLSFSAKPMQNKKDVELKALLNAGYDHVIPGHINLSLEIDAYKKFEVKKINTIFNVGGGLDFSNYFLTGKYYGLVRPYFSTEIGGYVSKDVRMYTDIKLGVGLLFGDKGLEAHPKAGISLGLTYKEHFTIEVAGNFPTTVSIGFGSRFGF